jgi:nucleoside-diphosphate-sugar epimerase
MNLLVTGANGFLGRFVVAEALRRGHCVRAVVRSAGDVARNGWEAGPNLTFVQADLRRRKGLSDAVAGVDAVLHLAASKAGDMYAQYAGTVVATENLLAAMTEANVRRIVSISSFSVYDYLKIRSFSVLTETSPLETDAFNRDEYAHTKLVQERLVRDHAAKNGWDFVILRPGVIYGRDNLWTARLGMRGGKIWLRTGAWARLPLAYVENCADAIVTAAERAGEGPVKGSVLNVLDDDPPTQRHYARQLQRRMSPRPIILPVAWTVMRSLAGLATLTNKLLLGGRAKVPGIFIPARLHARCKPLRFDNSRIKRTLGWSPRYSLEEALDRSFAAGPSSDGVESAAPSAAPVPAGRDMIKGAA